ncbi:heavy-metal-associated domain-containing protein [Maridesulfovibrio zosterae]|uniref:heavy-metal-associated domain-containing protein n=1 Tax=Maridesulfovibrio zosterae TaxID=82171 RepID=UPI00041063BC|nr:heavy metal-associated domain-containing protein [Maridesulfovibrio zosterae]
MKTIEVKGMSCQHCVSSVEKVLSGIDGLINVKVSLENGCATFDESSPVEVDKIKEMINKIGFEAGEIK